MYRNLNFIWTITCVTFWLQPALLQMEWLPTLLAPVVVQHWSSQQQQKKRLLRLLGENRDKIRYRRVPKIWLIRRRKTSHPRNDREYMSFANRRNSLPIRQPAVSFQSDSNQVQQWEKLKVNWRSQCHLLATRNINDLLRGLKVELFNPVAQLFVYLFSVLIIVARCWRRKMVSLIKNQLLKHLSM